MNVEPHDRGRHHAEVRERRVTTADARHAKEDVTEAVRLGEFLKLGSRVGDGDELTTCPVHADSLLDQLEEVLLEDVGLERRSRLAGDDEERAVEVQLLLEGSHLGRVGGVQDVQLGKAFDPTERHLEDLGAEARSAHPQEQGVADILLLGQLGDPLEPLQVGLELVLGDSQPAQPVGLIATGPEGGVPSPQTSHLPVRLPIIERRLHLCGVCVGQPAGLPPSHRLRRRLTAILDGAEQLGESLREQPHAVGEQPVGDVTQGDVQLLEGSERAPCTLEILLQREATSPVLPEGVVGRGRYRIDSVATDQLLHVEHIAVFRVLRAGARPEQPLRLSARIGERFPAGTAEQFLIALIGELGVGDGGPAEQFAQTRPLVGVLRFLELLRDDRVDRRVYPADEEARHTGDPGRVASALDEALESPEVGLGHPLVHVPGEEQRDVDVDAVGDELLDGRYALLCGGHLDHGVVTADGLPEAAGFCDGAGGVVGELRRDLEADIAVAAVRRLVDRRHHVGRHPDILDG